MKILVLGGTGWLSSHVARIALEQGHAVTCVSRGTSAPEATSHANARTNGATYFIADRDNDDALTPLAQQQWDAVIDVSRQPGQVRRAVRDLAAAAKRYVFVSTISVYAANDQPGSDESADRLDPLSADDMATMADYGSAKVACEDAVLDAFGADRAVIARPGLIGGPGDATGRTTYWPWRFAHPAHPAGVVVPDQPDLVTAVIDVRDLAAWLVRAASGPTGTFNLLGERLTLADHLAIARDVAVVEGGGPRRVAVTGEFLSEHGVNPWAGDDSLPLWLPDPAAAAMSDRSSDAALAAGLVLRPLVDTLRDGMWWRSNNGGTAGLSDETERRVLDDWLA